jgi:hypothetical protein
MLAVRAASIEPELTRAKTVKMTCYDAMHERNRLSEAIEGMAASGRPDVKKLLVCASAAAGI